MSNHLADDWKEAQMHENKKETEVKGNRTYKDTVFRILFRDKKELLSLYNAMNSSHYTDPDMLGKR